MAHKTPTKNKYWTSHKFMKHCVSFGYHWCFNGFCVLPTLQVLFLSIIYLTSSGDPPPTLSSNIRCVSKGLLAALKDKGKHPTMLLSGESGSNKKKLLIIILPYWNGQLF